MVSRFNKNKVKEIAYLLISRKRRDVSPVKRDQALEEFYTFDSSWFWVNWLGLIVGVLCRFMPTRTIIMYLIMRDPFVDSRACTVDIRTTMGLLL